MQNESNFDDKGTNAEDAARINIGDGATGKEWCGKSNGEGYAEQSNVQEVLSNMAVRPEANK